MRMDPRATGEGIGTARMASLGAAAVAFLLAVPLALPAGAAAQGSAPPQCVDGQDQDADGTADDFDQEDGPLYCDTNGAVVGPPAGTPPPDGGGGFGGGPCETTAGPATISNVRFQKAGGGWEPYTGQCMIQFQEQPSPDGGTMRYLTISFTDPSGNQDLASFAPAGTRMSAHIESTGAAPLFVLSSGLEVVAGVTPDDNRAVSQSMTVQGTVPTVEFAFQSGPGGINCAGGTQMMDFYGLVIQFQGEGPLAETMNKFSGFVVGGTFQSISFNPQATTADGDIGITTEGCGNVITQITVPSDGLALGGLSPSLLNQLAPLGDNVPDKLGLNDVVDNGQQVPQQQFDAGLLSQSQITPDSIPGAGGRHSLRGRKDPVGAVGIDYRSGAGSHAISTAPDKAAVKKAKKAVKKCKGGKLKVSKGKLVCKKKR